MEPVEIAHREIKSLIYCFTGTAAPARTGDPQIHNRFSASSSCLTLDKPMKIRDFCIHLLYNVSQTFRSGAYTVPI